MAVPVTNTSINAKATVAAPAAAVTYSPRAKHYSLANNIRSLSTLLFWVGLVLVPFDNLPFALSSGWATIAPFFFFAYVCVNLDALGRIRFRPAYGAGLLLIFAFQGVNLLRYGVHMGALVDTLGTFTLGLFFFLALIIRYEVQKASFNEDAKVLYRAYLVAFLYGIVWLCMAAFTTDNQVGVFEFMERRYYDRLAFSFTEPSFISMHVYGVLFLFTYFVSDRKLARKMIALGFAFVLLSILCKSSARAIVDLVVFAALLLTRTTVVDSRHTARNAFLWVLVIGGCLVVLGSSTRLQSILMNGVNADGSMASRFFRIQCMVFGFLHDPLGLVLGFGPGNMIVPFQAGYGQAFELYTSDYVKEVSYLGVATEIDNMFCMPVRLISDFGLIVSLGFLVLIIWWAKKSRIDPCVVIMTLWLYVQSDSYAFFALWLLFYLFRAYDPKAMGRSYFDIFKKNSSCNEKRKFSSRPKLQSQFQRKAS